MRPSNNNSWNDNNWNSQGLRVGGFRSNARNDGQRNDSYRGDSSRSNWRSNSNYQDTRVYNNSNYSQGNAPPPRPDFNRPPANHDSNPLKPIKQIPSANATAVPAVQPACNRHETQTQTECYGEINPKVFPENTRYSGSIDGGQA